MQSHNEFVLDDDVAVNVVTLEDRHGGGRVRRKMGRKTLAMEENLRKDKNLLVPPADVSDQMCLARCLVFGMLHQTDGLDGHKWVRRSLSLQRNPDHFTRCWRVPWCGYEWLQDPVTDLEREAAIHRQFELRPGLASPVPEDVWPHSGWRPISIGQGFFLPSLSHQSKRGSQLCWSNATKGDEWPRWDVTRYRHEVWRVVWSESRGQPRLQAPGGIDRLLSEWCGHPTERHGQVLSRLPTSQQCQPDEVCHYASIHLQQSVQSRPHATRHDIVRASQWVYSSSKPVHRGFGVVVMAKRTTRVVGWRYHEETQTCFEFNGCFWHGCPKCHQAERSTQGLREPWVRP